MNTALKALEQAMQLERDGRAFYLQAAERTSDRRGREMYLSLADDEKLHLQLLERQYHAVKANQGWQALPEIWDIDTGWDEPLFPKDKTLFEKAVHPEASDLDALIFALQIEHKSFELYRQWAQKSSEPAAKAMYKWLACAERGHFNQLMLNYESLLNSGYWAD